MPPREGGISATPSFERKIVTSNVGRRNTIDLLNPIYVAIIDKTLATIEEALMRRCGPIAGYSMIVNGMKGLGMFEPNMFTRDGIDILSALEFMSPIEAIQKDIITYVGDRVDADAKDGTTTSMLFVTKMLRMMNDMRSSVMKRGASIHTLNHATSNVFTNIHECLEKTYRFTYDDISEDKERAAGTVAYMQALSSSGGNYELAEAMRQVFEKSPQDTWMSMTYRSAPKETSTIYSVEVAEYQDRVDAHVVNNVMNMAMGTEYHAENAKVLIYADALDDMAYDGDRILQYFGEVDKDTSVVFICPLIPGKIITTVEQMNKARTKKIALFQYNPKYMYHGAEAFYDLDILNCRGYVHLPLNSQYVEPEEPCTDDFTFTCPKIIYHHGVIEFYGHIESTKSGLHPLYEAQTKGTPYYRQVLSGVNEGIKNNTGTHGDDHRVLEMFLEMRDKLISLNRPYLRIGGTTHDHMAAIPVVRDVQGAIMASLRGGFLINGALSMYSAIHAAGGKYVTDTGKYLDTLESDIYRCIRESMRDIIAHIYSLDKANIELIDKHVCGRNEYMNVLAPRKDYKYEISDYCDTLYRDELTGSDISIINTAYPVLMPYAIVDELFKRTKELFPKYITTDTYIVRGGVVIEEETDGDTAGN